MIDLIYLAALVVILAGLVMLVGLVIMVSIYLRLRDDLSIIYGAREGQEIL